MFNDVAVAARLMQSEWHRCYRHTRPPLQVAVVDLDVHQGNGTARIFHNDASVFTLSLHGARNFPFRKEQSDLDVELPDGCTDEPYGLALEGALQQMWDRLAETPAGLVFYLAGADAHEGDRLGRLALTHAGMAHRDHTVLEACRKRGIPVAISMAGGYGRELRTTLEVQMQTMQEALQSWQAWRCAPGAQAREVALA